MILVCGDAMVDRYWFGDAIRISPEAPVPVVAVKRTETRQGAACNVAANCLAMGAETATLYSATPPIEKIRVIGRNQQIVRIDHDVTMQPVQGFEAAVAGAGIVLFSDYGKGSLSNIEELIGQSKGRTILIDPKGADYRRYRGASVLKPNVDEMREMVGGWSSEEQLSAKALKLRQDAQVGAILLTRASDGMTLFEERGGTHIPCEAREVYDVTGAGDTAIAALACALERGYDLVTAARYANKAAGIAVTRFGTAVIHEREVFG